MSICHVVLSAAVVVRRFTLHRARIPYRSVGTAADAYLYTGDIILTANYCNNNSSSAYRYTGMGRFRATTGGLLLFAAADILRVCPIREWSILARSTPYYTYDTNNRGSRLQVLL